MSSRLGYAGGRAGPADARWLSSEGAAWALGELRRSPVGAQGQYACSRMSCPRLGTRILWRCVPKHARLLSARGACCFVSQGKKTWAQPGRRPSWIGRPDGKLP